MYTISLPARVEDVMFTISEIARRAPDATILPLFVDYTNSRVLIGATAASSSPAKLEVTGDIKVIGSGNGCVLVSRDGTKYGRLILENPDANGNLQLSVDPL